MLWQDVADVADLSGRDPLRKDAENGTRRHLRRNCRVRAPLGPLQRMLDTAEEVLAGSGGRRCPGGIPGLEIEAADQHRELCRELRRLPDGQEVTERVQRAAQGEIG